MSIIEVIAGLILVLAVLFSSTLLFTRSSHSMAASQYRAVAKDMATSALQELKQEPYYSLALTPADPNIFTQSGTNPTGGCDCSQEDLFQSALVSTFTNVNSVVYQTRSCANLVDRDDVTQKWKSYCPPISTTNDTGLVNLRIAVAWMVGQATQTLVMEGIVHR